MSSTGRCNSILNQEGTLSPLGWEHINRSGDYVRRTNLKLGQRKFRSLRSVRCGTLNLPFIRHLSIYQSRFE
ncbi:hypothetical protein FK514_22030 [Klebsiella pneumoniae]|nr:hypothetical protein [Klebsiella oxytoca]MCQ4050981.1 hypothetical protein [Klebsiella pneumoniae]